MLHECLISINKIIAAVFLCLAVSPPTPVSIQLLIGRILQYKIDGTFLGSFFNPQLFCRRRNCERE